MRLALTRDLSPAIARCELTHLSRQPIDLERARRQHETYEQRLQQAGCSIVRLEADDEMADAVFIEDTAVVFDELAIMTRPGAPSRRRETAAVAAAMKTFRSVVHIEAPAAIDGGDVLTVGKRVFVGQSARTNAVAISQLARHLAPHGYTVHPVAVRGCLHLKSAVTAIAEDTLLINPAWVAVEHFRPLTLLEVDPAESDGANALLVGAEVIYPTAFPRTAARLQARGIRVSAVDVSELAKAEGAVTCCSVVFRA